MKENEFNKTDKNIMRIINIRILSLILSFFQSSIIFLLSYYIFHKTVTTYWGFLGITILSGVTISFIYLTIILLFNPLKLGKHFWK